MSKSSTPLPSLKVTSSGYKYTPEIKWLATGGTNDGKTVLGLNSALEFYTDKKIIFINTDQPENFLKNFNQLTEEQKKRIIQPHIENVYGARIGNVDAIRALKDEILSPPISIMINKGEVGLIVVDSLDVVQEAYERHIIDRDTSGTPEMYLKGRAKNEMERNFLVPLINQPCGFYATSFYKDVYPKNIKGMSSTFKPPESVMIGQQMVALHEPTIRDSMWKHFTCIFELRNLNPNDKYKSQINAYIIKSKWKQGTSYGDHIIQGDKKNRFGPSFKKLYDYDTKGVK